MLSNDPNAPVSRISKPFDPVLDLAFIKSVYRMTHVLGKSDDDASALQMLSESFRSRGFDDVALPLLERLTRISPSNPARKLVREMAKTRQAEVRKQLGPEPNPLDRPNPSAVERELEALLSRGRAHRGGVDRDVFGGRFAKLGDGRPTRDLAAQFGTARSGSRNLGSGERAASRALFGPHRRDMVGRRRFRPRSGLLS